MRDRRTDEHHAILESKLGRKLRPDEVADHVNMDKTDNRKANLRPETRSEHSKRHGTRESRTTGRIVKALTMSRRGEKLY